MVPSALTEVCIIHCEVSIDPNLITNSYAENLSAGTGDFGIAAAIKIWTDEAGM